MAVMTERADVRHVWRQVLEQLARLLYGLGWLVAKTVWLVLVTLGATLFAAGWLARKTVPALRWCGSAVALGWDAARAPDKKG